MLGTNVYNNVCLRLWEINWNFFKRNYRENQNRNAHLHLNSWKCSLIIFYHLENRIQLENICIIWIRESYISHFQLYFAHPIYVYYTYICAHLCTRAHVCEYVCVTCTIHDIFIYAYIYAFRPSVYMLKYTWSAM